MDFVDGMYEGSNTNINSMCERVDGISLIRSTWSIRI